MSMVSGWSRALALAKKAAPARGSGGLFKEGGERVSLGRLERGARPEATRYDGRT